jgi:hypothetical protein
MAVDHAQIDCPARPASREEYIEHGVPATSAALMVDDHSMSRPMARRRFQRFDDELRL